MLARDWPVQIVYRAAVTCLWQVHCVISYGMWFPVAVW